jgi:hypothetical protein
MIGCLVPHDWLLPKIAASGVELRVVICIREFQVGRTQSFRVGGLLSEEVRVMSGVVQGSILGPLLFLVYINDILKNNGSAIRLFADGCVIYREIVNNNDIKRLQIDPGRLEEWAVKTGTNRNPGKSKAVSFTKFQVNDLINYSLLDQVNEEVSSCKYLGIILCSDFSWTDHVKYMAKEAWKAIHFTMHILKKGNSNMESLAYTALVRLILDYGAACWDPVWDR